MRKDYLLPLYFIKTKKDKFMTLLAEILWRIISLLLQNTDNYLQNVGKSSLYIAKNISDVFLKKEAMETADEDSI